MPRPVCGRYPPDCTDRSDVLMGRWTTATSRMTCLTGGRTPCSAATGIPGRRATSSSPMCGARAAPMKACPGTPRSGARQTAAAQRGTARGTTPRHSALRDTGVSDPKTWLGDRTRSGEHNTVGSHVGSHRQSTPCDSEPTEVFDNPALEPGIQLLWPTPADRRGLVRIEGQHTGLLGATWKPGFTVETMALQSAAIPAG